jgi:nucleoside-diphosphate-sugar epimerase
MTLKTLVSGRNGTAYNIGNPSNEISIKNLANLLAPLSQRPIQVNVLGVPNTSAPLRSCPDISL